MIKKKLNYQWNGGNQCERERGRKIRRRNEIEWGSTEEEEDSENLRAKERENEVWDYVMMDGVGRKGERHTTIEECVRIRRVWLPLRTVIFRIESFLRARLGSAYHGSARPEPLGFASLCLTLCAAGVGQDCFCYTKLVLATFYRVEWGVMARF